MPPMTEVPNSSPTYAIGRRRASGLPLNIQWNITPERNAPTMLPGNAMSEPSPKILRSRLAQNATPREYHGPR